MIIQCDKCWAKNRITSIPPNSQPICGKCKEPLNYKGVNTKDPFSEYSWIKRLSLYLGIVLAIIALIMITLLGQKDYSTLVASENEKVSKYEEQLKKQLNEYENSLQEELSKINSDMLFMAACEHYKTILTDRISRNAKYALTPREKTLLKMKGISTDSTKYYLDAIKEIAKEASPKQSEIIVKETEDGVVLEINFQMSSVTSGEKGTRTKHETVESLKNEVVSLTSRVSTDVFSFCNNLNLRKIYIGCKHDVNIVYENYSKSQQIEQLILYKVKIEKDKINTLSDNPFLDTYSITSILETEEDHFNEISITEQK